MADDTLPIVFRTKPSGRFLVPGLGIFSLIVGIAKISDNSFAFSTDHIGPFEVSPQTAGWLLVAFGAALTLLGLVTIVRRCPALTIDQTGIASIRCFGSPLHVPWNRLADVRVKTVSVPGRWRTTYDVVVVVTDDGKEVSVGNLDHAGDVADTIRRVAARMKDEQGGTATPAPPPSTNPA